MIEFLRGRVADRDGTHLVIDVNGVGYGVDVPVTTLDAIAEAGDEPVELHIYFHLGEQVMRLFGFATKDERHIFEVLLGTSGIGPKTALSILSAVDIAQFARAVVRNDLSLLTKIPGVGKKTAERLALELRDKLTHYAAAMEGQPGAGRGKGKAGAALEEAPLGGPTAGPLGETAAALLALGCRPAVAERATLKAAEFLGESAPVDQLIREALKHR